MTLPEGEVCICREAAKYALCGRRIDYIPAGQPQFPSRVHQRCHDLMWSPSAPPVVYGSCPVCGQRAVVEGGRVQAHRLVQVDRDGALYESVEACLGVNMAPGVWR